MGSHTVQTFISTQDISPLHAWKGGNIKSNHLHILFGRTQSGVMSPYPRGMMGEVILLSA